MITIDPFKEFPFRYYSHSTLNSWLQMCVRHYEHVIERLSYQFCDETMMLEYNRQFLDHDYYTDILTFPENARTNPVKGDVLINVDRLVDNAAQYNQVVTDELLRLMAHGLLHLCGFRDEDPADKRLMTIAENVCIQLMAEVDK